MDSNDSKCTLKAKSKPKKIWNDSTQVDYRCYEISSTIKAVKTAIPKPKYIQPSIKKSTAKSSFAINQAIKTKEISKENERMAAKIKKIKSTINK